MHHVCDITPGWLLKRDIELDPLILRLRSTGHAEAAAPKAKAKAEAATAGDPGDGGPADGAEDDSLLGIGCGWMGVDRFDD